MSTIYAPNPEIWTKIYIEFLLKWISLGYFFFFVKHWATLDMGTLSITYVPYKWITQNL